jgi:hypothetical protein
MVKEAETPLAEGKSNNDDSKDLMIRIHPVGLKQG